MTVTAAQVKELRDRTGAGMMDAKKALTEADGDIEKAMEVLRQKGMATAEKKSGRVTAEGLVASHINADASAGVLVEVNCETDFVAKGDKFQALVDKLVPYVAGQSANTAEELLAAPAPEGNGTVKDYLTEQVATIKENITLRRFVKYEAPATAAVHAYIHIGGKIGVLVECNAQNRSVLMSEAGQQLMKDVAMQVASFSAEFVSRAEVSQDVIDEETRVEMGKEDIQAKPENIREKIVSGRVDKLIGARVLLEQAFIKDPGKTVADHLAEQSKALGDSVTVTRFTRYALGEGIERQETSFADEVAAAAGVGS